MKPGKTEDILEELKSARGKWTLTPNHELFYHSRQKNEEIKFKGSIFQAKPDALVVSYEIRQTDQKTVTGIFDLAGSWSLDAKNRILFQVEKENGKKDMLIFRGGWNVSESNQIIYSYTQTQLKTKKKIEKELVFKGYWDISEKNRLTYLLGGDSENTFRVRGTFQTKSILAKKGEIRYQAGIEINGKSKTRVITLFGKWLVSRDLGLFFEMDYGREGARAIEFGGEYRLKSSSEIALKLKTRSQKFLGVELVLSKEIFKDAQAFVRIQKTLEESRVDAGVGFKW